MCTTKEIIKDMLCVHAPAQVQ